MGSLQEHLRCSLLAMSAPVSIVTAGAQLKIVYEPALWNAYTQILYSKQTGRRQGMALRALDRATGKVVVEHTFTLRNSEASRQGQTNLFAARLTEYLKGRLPAPPTAIGQ